MVMVKVNGAMVAQVVGVPFGNRKVAGSSPALPNPIEVSLSKTLNPKLLPVAGWRLAWQPPPPVCECVGEWVNERHIL